MAHILRAAQFVIIVQFFTQSLAASIFNCDPLDLTHTLDQDNHHLPMYREFVYKYRQKGQFQKIPFIAWNFYTVHEHVGTHADAPSHFLSTGKSIDEVPLRNLMGEACVLNIMDKVDQNPGYSLEVKDIQEWEENNGPVGNTCVFLLNTGQSRRWHLRTYAKVYPGFSEEAAEYLVAKGVRGVGIDSLSLDPSADRFEVTFPAQTVFLANGEIPTFENLKNLQGLPARGASFFGMPTKIKGGTGAQIRAFALGWRGTSDPCNANYEAKIKSTIATKQLSANANSISITVSSLILCSIAVF